MFIAAALALAINTGLFTELSLSDLGHVAGAATWAFRSLAKAPRISYAVPLPPAELSTCFGHIDGSFRVRHNFSDTQRGDAAAVVPLNALMALAAREGSSLRQAAASALYGFLEGGTYHVILVPGDAHFFEWDAEGAVAAVREAVAAAVDFHGVHLPTHFSAVPPETVECLGVDAISAGAAWAVATGAQSVLSLEEVSPMTRVSLRFGTVDPRFLVQITSSGPAAEAQPGGPSSSVSRGGAPALPLPPLRKHFQACGGSVGPNAAQCDPLPDALHLCANWLRPVVQYGLCHPAADYSYGRHDTVAANSPHLRTLYSGHRLLEDVAPVTMPLGGVTALSGLVADASFAEPGRALTYNRLADRSAAWALVPRGTGAGGQVSSGG
jgi:hypothetical protein